MTYENIKTTILTILVLLSGILTWNIWTYQPKYEIVPSEKTVEEVSIGMKKEIRKVVKPHQVIYHIGGEQYGTIDNEHIDNMIATISKWKFFDVNKYPGRIADFNEKLVSGSNTEIIFPDEVPIDLFKRVLNIDEKDLPKFDFDRIIIHAETQEKQDGIIYFYSQQNQQIFESNVNPTFINQFAEKFYKRAGKLTPYFLYSLSDTKRIYLPASETEMMKYTYYRIPLEMEQFKEALFNDPSFVQRNIMADREEYMDDYSKMTFDRTTKMISYVNPIRYNDSVIGTSNVLQKSIEFINSHGGWTDAYRYVYKDDFNQKVRFRLYSKEGYPVFNSIGMSEIHQQWTQSQISRYIRPGFQLELQLKQDMETEKLPSGYKALKMLEAKKNFKPELLGNLMLGYYMREIPTDERLISLEPGWFYLYNQEWRRLISEEEARNLGLEQN